MTRTTVLITFLLLFSGGTSPASAAEPVATITEMHGLVRIERGAAREISAAELSAPVFPGDAVITLAESRARLQFADGTRLSLGPSSRMHIALPSGRTRRLSLAAGFARFWAAKLPGGLEVSTPTAIAAVKGTDFALAVSDAATDISVVEGEVLCQDRERRYAVVMRGGETARWDRNGLWTPVRPLRSGERDALEGGQVSTPPPSLRLGGYVTFDYVRPLAKGAADTFSNPWTSLQASSTLGPSAHTFWEIWLTQGGNDQLLSADGHGRLDLLQAWVEVSPFASTRGPAPLSLRAGVLPVPVGLLNRDHDLPRRTFTGFPAWNDWIVPVPWRDLGVQVTSGWDLPAGTVRLEAAVINGLQLESTTIFDGWQPVRSRQRFLWWARPSEDERSFGRDNNGNKALAGRFGWTVPGLAAGLSAYSGRAGAYNVNQIAIVQGDLAAAIELGGWRVATRGEAGRATLALAPGQPAGLWGDWPVAGGYAELEAAPPFAPISLGIAAAPMFHGRLFGRRIRDDYRVAIAIRAVPGAVLKIEGRRIRSRGPAGWTSADLLDCQVSAFW
ncbi:MAG: FecR family protein [Candidatus Coatesbacteria bacterium]